MRLFSSEIVSLIVYFKQYISLKEQGKMHGESYPQNYSQMKVLRNMSNPNFPNKSFAELTLLRKNDIFKARIFKIAPCLFHDVYIHYIYTLNSWSSEKFQNLIQGLSPQSFFLLWQLAGRCITLFKDRLTIQNV